MINDEYEYEFKRKDYSPGDGHNSIQDERHSSILKSPQIKTVPICQCTCEEKSIASEEELEKELSGVLGLSANIHNVNVKSNSELGRKINFSSFSQIYMVKITYIEESHKLEGPYILNERVKDLHEKNDNGLEFYTTFGDEIVSKVDYGKVLILLIKVKDGQRIKTWNFKEELSVDTMFGGGNILLKYLKKKLFKYTEFELNSYTIGMKCPIPYFQSDAKNKLEEIVKKFGETEQNSKCGPIHVNFSSYTEIETLDIKRSKDIEKKIEKADEISTPLIKWFQICQQLIDEIENFVTEDGSIEIAKLRENDCNEERLKNKLNIIKNIQKRLLKEIDALINDPINLSYINFSSLNETLCEAQRFLQSMLDKFKKTGITIPIAQLSLFKRNIIVRILSRVFAVRKTHYIKIPSFSSNAQSLELKSSSNLNDQKSVHLKKKRLKLFPKTIAKFESNDSTNSCSINKLKPGQKVYLASKNHTNFSTHYTIYAQKPLDNSFFALSDIDPYEQVDLLKAYSLLSKRVSDIGLLCLNETKIEGNFFVIIKEQLNRFNNNVTLEELKNGINEYLFEIVEHPSQEIIDSLIDRLNNTNKWQEDDLYTICECIYEKYNVNIVMFQDDCTTAYSLIHEGAANTIYFANIGNWYFQALIPKQTQQGQNKLRDIIKKLRTSHDLQTCKIETKWNWRKLNLSDYYVSNQQITDTPCATSKTEQPRKLAIYQGKNSNLSKQKTESPVQAQSTLFSPASPFSLRTKGEGDCAFHATLGTFNLETNQIEVENVDKIRKLFADKIRGVTTASPLFPLISDAIMAIVMEEKQIQGKKFIELKQKYKECEETDNALILHKWNIFEKELNKYSSIKDYLSSYIKNYINKKNITDEVTKNNLCSNLKEQFIIIENEASKESKIFRAMIMSFKELENAYQEYKKPNQSMDFKQLLQNPELIEEYASILQRPGEWLLPCEINMIAYVFNITIHYYADKNAAPERFNPDRKNSVSVCFDGYGHYEQMTALPNYQYKENQNNKELNKLDTVSFFKSATNLSSLVITDAALKLFPILNNVIDFEAIDNSDFPLIKVIFADLTTAGKFSEQLASNGLVLKDGRPRKPEELPNGKAYVYISKAEYNDIINNNDSTYDQLLKLQTSMKHSK